MSKLGLSYLIGFIFNNQFSKFYVIMPLPPKKHTWQLMLNMHCHIIERARQQEIGHKQQKQDRRGKENQRPFHTRCSFYKLTLPVISVITAFQLPDLSQSFYPQQPLQEKGHILYSRPSFPSPSRGSLLHFMQFLSSTSISYTCERPQKAHKLATRASHQPQNSSLPPSTISAQIWKTPVEIKLAQFFETSYKHVFLCNGNGIASHVHYQPLRSQQGKGKM